MALQQCHSAASSRSQLCAVQHSDRRHGREHGLKISDKEENSFAETCQERGQTIILVAIGLVSLLAMAALAIDLVTLYAARSETQRAADAAALVAAKAIADSGFTTLSSTDPHLVDGSAQALAQTMATCRDQCDADCQQPADQSGGRNTADNGVVVGTPTISFPFANPPNSNPYITVKLQVTGLPIFFARIWGNRTASVTASATAEAYNPANVENFTPIAPKGVKPWLVANRDPMNNPPTHLLLHLQPGYRTWRDRRNVQPHGRLHTSSANSCNLNLRFPRPPIAQRTPKSTMYRRWSRRTPTMSAPPFLLYRRSRIPITSTLQCRRCESLLPCGGRTNNSHGIPVNPEQIGGPSARGRNV